MIWRGVDGPKDFVAIVNRFPPHVQRLTNALKQLFVAKSIGKSTGFYLLACSSLPTCAAFGMIWPVASSGGLMPFLGPAEVANVPFVLKEIPRIQKFNSAKRRRISLFDSPRQDENTDNQEFRDTVTFHWKSMIQKRVPQINLAAIPESIHLPVGEYTVLQESRDEQAEANRNQSGNCKGDRENPQAE